MAPALIEGADGRFGRLIADRSYDSNAHSRGPSRREAPGPPCHRPAAAGPPSLTTAAAGRPRVLLISPGNTSDMTMAPTLIDAASGRFDR